MRERDDVSEAKGSVCRCQMTGQFAEKESSFVSNSECTRVARVVLQPGFVQDTVHAIRAEGSQEEIDSAKAIGSMEISVTCEEPNALKLDEYTEELLDVFDSISGTRLDPELLKVSRQVELDFMSQQGVYRKRPRTWGTDRGFPVISTKWVDVNKGTPSKPECRSRLCGKELKRWAPTIPGTFASMGPLECVILLFSKALMRKPGASGPLARKIMFLDASRAHCQADATSEMAIELPPEEQVKGQDLVGELLNSLYGTRKAAHSWERKWQSGLVEMNLKIGTWPSAIVCCCEREVCRFVHGDNFIFVGESTQLAWTESRVDEKLILKKEAVLGPDDGDDKTVTILILFGDLGLSF